MLVGCLNSIRNQIHRGCYKMYTKCTQNVYKMCTKCIHSVYTKVYCTIMYCTVLQVIEDSTPLEEFRVPPDSVERSAKMGLYSTVLCILYCTVHSLLYCTMFSIIYCTVHSILYCMILLIMCCSVHSILRLSKSKVLCAIKMLWIKMLRRNIC